MVTGSDMILVKSANMPVDESSTCGGAKTATEITGSVEGEVFPNWPAEPADGDDKTRYQKIFLKNSHATDEATDVSFYLPGALDTSASAGKIKAVSSSADDDDSTKLYIIMMVDGDWTYENLTLDGTDEVEGSKTVDLGSYLRIELRNVSDSLQVAAHGDITIKQNDVVLGVIPAGYFHALHEFQIGAEGSLNDSTTIANTLTAPGGIAFSKPRTEGTAIAAFDDMAAGDGQGIWVKWVIKAGILPLAGIKPVIRICGSGS